MSFSFEWVNGCDFFNALDGMGRQQKQKKVIDTILRHALLRHIYQSQMALIYHVPVAARKYTSCSNQEVA